MSHVFIAYSRDDAAVMRDLREGIQSHGFKVWTDEDISRTDPDWELTIREWISRACCVVGLFSPSACNSRWVKGELTYAEATEVPVLCVLVDGGPKNAVPILWQNANMLDLRNQKPVDWDSAVARDLISEIRKLC
jgi:hypothetical protein